MGNDEGHGSSANDESSFHWLPWLHSFAALWPVPAPARFAVTREELDDGPWMREPDVVFWRSPTGIDCAILRNTFFSLCGYAGVHPAHPLYRLTYQQIDDAHLDVHGGLTFSDGGLPVPPEFAERLPSLWWFGFDCGHGNDLSPGLEAQRRKLMPPHLVGMQYEAPDDLLGGTYRDVAYVHAQVEHLAAVLAAVQSEVAKARDTYRKDPSEWISKPKT